MAAKTTDWKGSFPLTIFLLAVAALYFGNAPVSGTFLNYIVLGTVWLLLLPIFSESGISKEAKAWFVRAAAFAYISAAFMLLQGTFIDVASWSKWLVEIGAIFSWLMAGIGGIVILGTTK